MLAGSDYSGEWEVSGFSLHQEFALPSQDGFSSMKILQMTTLNAAKFYGREATMGSVDVRRNADLELLDGDPTQSAKNLDRIEAVFRDGTFYSRATLDAKLSEIARQDSSSP
jgi:imidazolonepropionase-like amidohydrolase